MAFPHVGIAPATALEVSWCRQYMERAEREYGAMVDGLLEENAQLEALARLLARHFQGDVDTGGGLGGSRRALVASANSGAGSLDAAAAVAEVVAHVDRVLRQGEVLKCQREEEVVALQREIRESRLEIQTLWRRLEDVMKELAEGRAKMAAAETRRAPHPPELVPDDFDSGSQWCGDGNASGTSAERVAQLERSHSHEIRQRELAEARCALIESRCQQMVQRLEGELATVRGSVAVSGGAVSSKRRAGRDEALRGTNARNGGGHAGDGRPGVCDYCGSGALPSLACGDEVLGLRSELQREREAHQEQIAIYKRYIEDLAAAYGKPPPQAYDSVPDGKSSRRPSTPTEVHSPRSEHVASDDEEYTSEGYLERAIDAGGGVGSDCFEKVYLELACGRLVVNRDRAASDKPLAGCQLDTLVRPAEVSRGVRGTESGGRCFEVTVRGEPCPWVFRCVSGRRAEQWVEAINRAHGRIAGPGNGRLRQAASVPGVASKSLHP